MVKKVFTGPKRPIDQSLINVVINNIDTSQINKTVRTAGMAETLIRIIIEGQVIRGTTALDTRVLLALVKVPDGRTASTMVITDLGTLYAPEQDVLWFRHISIKSDTDQAYELYKDIKAMRKLKKNDTIQLIAQASGSNVASFGATVRFWYKQ